MKSTAKVPSGFATNAAFIGEVVELQRHAFTVGFLQAEPQGAEGGSQKRGVELADSAGREYFVIEQVLEHEQAGDVGLGLFDGAESDP